MRKLFLLYLQKGESLNDVPRWYNTLTSNCTTLIFDMARQIEPIPADYRILLAGLLPEYLYDERAIDTRYTVAQWQKMAHANPHVTNIDKNISSAEFSRLIRQNLPTP